MGSDAEDYFNRATTNRDRALFELGIKLGTLFHQFSGTPIINEPAAIQKLEQGIMAAIGSQPFVSKVEVSLVPHPHTEQRNKTNPCDNLEVSGKNIKSEIQLIYINFLVTGKVEWFEDLNYPLMYVSQIEVKNRGE